MKTKIDTQQRGVASLLTAVILLVSITLVVLFTARTIVVETKISADTYRTNQAEVAASAAMDYAISYFMEGGIDQVQVNADGTDDSCTGDTVNMDLNSGGAASGRAQFKFDSASTEATNVCGCDIRRPVPCALVTAQGWSDDNTATRIIKQCVTLKPLFANDGKGPAQPFFSRASVGVAGNARIINRYNNSSIWTGGAMDTSGVSFGTYLRPSDKLVTDLTKAELDSDDESLNTQRVSDRERGIGIDVITNDSNLKNKTPDEVFQMFYGVNTSKADVAALADEQGQKYPSGSSDFLGKSELIWVDGDAAMSGTDTVGTADKPAILIVNGDFQLNGGTIYGAVYVTGELKVAGNPTVKGSLISESGTTSGAGTVRLVYVPFASNGCEDDLSITDVIGTKGVVTGSWRDW